jgi:hypothetical protein
MSISLGGSFNPIIIIHLFKVTTKILEDAHWKVNVLAKNFKIPENYF